MSAENPTHEVKKEHGDNPEEWQMMKAPALAVNKEIKEKIEPVDKKSGQVNEELYDLLARGNETKKKPKEYFRKKVNLPKEITFPRVLAEKCLYAKSAQWLVESMIQRQFDIKWDTPNGEPDDYSFYEFCDTEKTKKFFKYKPRRAHVNVTLYKECRRKQEMLDDQMHKPTNSLCPEVFVKTVDGWKIWQALDEEDKEGKFKPLTEDFSWIDPSIGNFIKENADIQKPDHNSLKQSLKKPTLYWAVIKDTDFPSTETENLQLKPIGKTQVYVGRAKNGIKKRWLEDGGSHCKMMKKCLDNVWAMKTYDPLRLKGIQLVDVRLALAKVRGETAALFVMKTFGDDLEKIQIAEEKLLARERHESLRRSVIMSAFKNGSSSESLSLDDSCELESLRNEIDNLKKKFSETTATPELQLLKAAEVLHQKGIRSNNESIFPSKEYGFSPEHPWKPTDMRYGMNGRCG